MFTYTYPVVCRQNGRMQAMTPSSVAYFDTFPYVFAGKDDIDQQLICHRFFNGGQI